MESTTLQVPGLVLVEHELSVPLDHSRPDGEQITLFAREVADPEGRDRPFLVFLQGGPGSEAPRPTRLPSSPAWLDRALADYRVLMVDQRGTGRSTPVGTLPGLTPQQQADRLVHFRADAIVADCELLREALGVDRWSVLGQSFGGFCTLRYLSAAPGALREAFFTGGVPPVGRPVDEVYAATYSTMRERNRRYHRTYPGDRARLQTVLDACEAGDVVLPGGDRVTARRFRGVGNVLGMSDGAARLHYLLELDPAAPGFGHDLAALLPFTDRNPLYVVVHEACYADGGVTGWSAQRTMPEDFRADPTLLTGEHVFPWVLEDDSRLAPLAEAAGILAEHEWPRLYDAEVLAAVDVPCAAAIYAEDAYVDRVFSEETARLVPTMRTWVTNELEHNGLRADGERVLDRLIGMARGRLA
ncbi:alpha/beta fold hydrolase [Nocardioides mesophilus]|uniref:Alpha/beta fold hydrolase n=1 Tax=Nocardioides mesophilus TaxID=433659 RepID=A0A7G9RFX4_9ACTN|nr:alpha/beta fold hydrolase [Nocardioides mesophilus]QNN54499.1 alpha/beta fold hydrolase [Nocardioides mesophilus]